jgi:copper resistance protein B
MFRRLHFLCAFAALALNAPAHAAPVEGGIDLFELHPGPDNTHLVMESTWELGQAVLKVDGGSETRPTFEDVTVQGLWMPEVAKGVKLAFGARQDLRPGDDLTHGVAGVEAELLPWLSGEHYLFLSQHGDLTGSGKLVARWPLAPGVALEPRVQLDWAARNIPREGLAAGATGLELSVRLRRSLGAHVDVYAGVIHERALGRSAAIAEADGSPVHVTRAVIGAGFSL